MQSRLDETKNKDATLTGLAGARVFLATLASLCGANFAIRQPGNPTPPPGAKAVVCAGRTIAQLEDITANDGVTFQHISDPEKKHIVESMSGGVILFDYHRCGDGRTGEALDLTDSSHPNSVALHKIDIVLMFGYEE